MRVRKFIFSLFATFAFVTAAAGEGLGAWAIDFGAVTIDGKAKVDLSESFKGKLLLMDFWATWCEPCMEEVPGLVAAWKKFGSGKLAFLGITLDSPGDLKKVQATAAKEGMTWPQVFDDGSDADGKGTPISAAYKVDGIPSPFLIDADTGRIVARGSELRGDRLQKTLESALKAKK